MARKVDSPHVAARAAAREALGLRLRVLRVGRKLSNKAVAASLDVRPATLSSWEQGTSELTALDALRLADLYTRRDRGAVRASADAPDRRSDATLSVDGRGPSW